MVSTLVHLYATSLNQWLKFSPSSTTQHMQTKTQTAKQQLKTRKLESRTQTIAHCLLWSLRRSRVTPEFQAYISIAARHKTIAGHAACARQRQRYYGKVVACIYMAATYSMLTGSEKQLALSKATCRSFPPSRHLATRLAAAHSP